MDFLRFVRTASGLVALPPVAVFSVFADEPDRLVRESPPLSPAEQEAKLHVPEGFAVRLFAAEPQINKPINLAFDERGRLWVSSTVEYPFAAGRERWVDEEGSRVRDSRDAIKILEDTDGDGRADRVVDFADGLNIPTGVLPWRRPEHHAGCIAWSIPNIWYFADTDGDGRADHREVLFGPLGYEKDTHGMCSSFRLGPDGWVYGTHGFNNTSHFRVREENLDGARPGDPGTELTLQSGNVYRFRPDGSRIEIWSWGQVNPFGLAFDRRGHLYSADCHSAPVYQLLRGACYPSFGKPHDGLGFGPTMIEHTHGSTGICGIVFLDGEVWGTEWNDHVLIGNAVTSRVNRDRIAWRGSTPVAIERPDFVVSDDPWFRPVDMTVGPDGALYIADFYNRIIGHYEVPLDHPGRDRERGRIWRVVKTEGDVRAPSPPRPVEVENPVKALGNGDPFERRAAAAAVQDRPEIDALPALAAALGSAPDEDTHLRHALRLALRETLKLESAFERLEELAEGERVADEVAFAVPTAEAAQYLLRRLETGSSDETNGGEAVVSHAGRYGDDALTRRVLAWIDAEENGFTLGRRVELFRAWHEGRIENERTSPVLDDEARRWAEREARGLLDAVPAAGFAWTEHALLGNATGPSPWIVQERQATDDTTIAVISSLRRGERGAEQRTGVLRSRPFAAPARMSFWICGHRGFPRELAHGRNHVRLVEAASGRELARVHPPRNDVAVRVEWNLSAHAGDEVVLEIVDGDAGSAYAWLGVGRFESGSPLSVESFSRSRADAEALRNLATVLAPVAAPALRDRLSPWLPPRPSAPVVSVSPERKAELDRLIAERVEAFDREKADPVRGEMVYRQHCAACHRVAGEGGLVGPQLDGVGSRGAARLAEDILAPNRNVDAHFHLRSLRLRTGETVGGFVVSETERVLRLLDAAGVEHRIRKSEVEESQVLGVSLMPAGFAETLSLEDFHDLLAFLLESA